MKKIPTLFEREFSDHSVSAIYDKVTPGFDWVLAGEGTATIKYDGSCCAIINGMLYKRYDAKRGKKPPEGAIPCCNPDPVTGHWPHWCLCSTNNPEDKWYVAAMLHTMYSNGLCSLPDGTYEAIGPHFQGNPYGLHVDGLKPHGEDTVAVERSFDGIKRWLQTHPVEGLVFWKDGEPQCKIKRRDFGLPWPVKEGDMYEGNPF